MEVNLKHFNPISPHMVTNRCSCPKTPKQNGRAKRKIRHIVESGMALLA